MANSFYFFRKSFLNRAISSLFIMLVGAKSFSQDDEEFLLGLYGDEDMISIATGVQQSISKAPAVASVISADAIAASGAMDLDEVLEAIPGLHVGRSNIGYNPVYTFRGIHSSLNAQVLVLINGIPITNLFHGDRGQSWGGMPVAGIARIEIIRGPGSAVYGAEAFAGTINILTRSAQDLDGVILKGSAGSFNTRDASFLYGGQKSGFDLAFMVEYHATDGQQELIEIDAQTGLDSFFGTSASLAPGPVSLSRNNLDLRLDVSKNNWQFRAGMQRRRDWGVGSGVAEALDPHARYKSDKINADLTWSDLVVDEQWDLSAQLSYLSTTHEIAENLIIFPPGVNLGGGVYPDGFIGNPEVLEKHLRATLSALYNGFDSHTFRIGAGHYAGDMYEVRESKNFGIDPNTGNLIPPTSDLVDVSDTPFVFLKEGKRNNTYAFIQDIWNIANDWELTAGVRYDKYSDFGSTVNPRVAIVWSSTQKMTTKFLLGSAFRAPSFAETRAINNPILLGNPDLDPETLSSQEIAFDYKVSDTLGLSLNMYQYQWEDIINFVPDDDAPTSTARNDGERDGLGWEFEFQWEPNARYEMSANYAKVSTKDKNNGGGHIAFAPHQQLFVKTRFNINDKAYIYSQFNHVMDRRREPGDTRDDADDFSLIGITAGYKLSRHLNIRVAVNNLLDEDAREPSAWSNPAQIPGDLPLAGRNSRLELTWQF